MGPATKYWLLLAVLLGLMYGSFVLLRRDQSSTLDREPLAGGVEKVTADRAPGKSQETAAEPIKEFVLTDESGQPFDSHSLDGKAWVGSFFFTNCPAVCWRLNQALAAWQETHPDSKIRFVSITCDPANDTPEALSKYAAHFKADPKRWTFLTGDMNLIRSIGNDFFKVAVEPGTHSDRAFVVDGAGKVRGRFRLTEPDQLAMLEKLLEVVEAEQATSPASAKPAATP
jgi:protein SCO1/2